MSNGFYTSINKKPKFVLDADISKCFDRIDHEALLRKLNTSPTIRRQVRAWLKAGVMDEKQLFPTSEGTPQDGVISPLLANIALHGMEERIKEFAETWKGTKRNNRLSLSLIRYADDFVILHEDITVVQRCREIISEWLLDMGLELKPAKTRLTHTLNECGSEKPGFNFLGFNIIQFKCGKHQSGKNSYGRLLGFKTIITPSKEKQKIHYDRVASIIDDHKGAPQAALIGNLNPIITGWSNYYSAVVSKVAYHDLDDLMYPKLKSWAKRRHPNKSKKWVAKKYWQTIGGDNWVFATKQGGKNPIRLRSHQETPIVRHVKVKGEASPYDGNLIYWSSRMGKHPEMSTRMATLLKIQKGKCTHCGLYFREGDGLEVDHITPKAKGEETTTKTFRYYIDTATTEKQPRMARLPSASDKRRFIEEPCNGKLLSTVLKTSGFREELAEFNEAGYKSLQDCIKEQQYTLQLFPELKEIYFCPDFAGKKCFRVTRHNVHNHSKTKWSGQYRKPGAGMLKLAMVRHHHTPDTSLYVGDRPEDEIAARRAGIPFYPAADWRQQHQQALV